MKTEKNKYGITQVFYYREDLEKMSTHELIWIMRSYAISRSKIEKELFDDDSDFDGKMREFSYDDTHEYYAVPWIVRDILKNRPHIHKSKQERRQVRQMRAKYHISNNSK